MKMKTRAEENLEECPKVTPSYGIKGLKTKDKTKHNIKIF